jgi:hypothetical protein
MCVHRSRLANYPKQKDLRREIVVPISRGTWSPGKRAYTGLILRQKPKKKSNPIVADYSILIDN